MIKKLKELMAMMSTTEGTLFTYALAYSMIVGIAPFIILAVVFIGTYVYNVDQIILLLQRYIPGDLIIPFVEYIKHTDASDITLVLSLFGVSVWVASKSIYSFLLLTSDHDGVETAHFKLRILAVFYFVFILIGISVVLLLINYVPFINRFVVPLLMFVFFIFLYRLLSFRYTAIIDVLYGAIFASVSLTIFGRMFFMYVNNFSNYENIYGPLASLMIALISSWLISWVVYCGYCINYVFRDQGKPIRQKKRLINLLNDEKD